MGHGRLCEGRRRGRADVKGVDENAEHMPRDAACCPFMVIMGVMGESISSLNLEQGQLVGGYVLESRLGGGAMGSVWRVRDGAGSEFAMKILRDSLKEDDGDHEQLTARERLRREAAALSRVRHPGITSIVDMELDDAVAFIVTELVEGKNLREDVAANGRYLGDDLERLAEKLISAVKAVHAAGIIHRDIKPTNVMVSVTGPVLVDFGIAMGEGESHVTRTGLVMGTPGFIAPEVIDGAESDEMTDWWSVASVLAFAATGRPVFGTKPMMAVLERAASGHADLRGLPRRTHDAFRAALAPDRARRCTPDQLLEAIRADAMDPSISSDMMAAVPMSTGSVPVASGPASSQIPAAAQVPGASSSSSPQPAASSAPQPGAGFASMPVAAAPAMPGHMASASAHAPAPATAAPVPPLPPPPMPAAPAAPARVATVAPSPLAGEGGGAASSSHVPPAAARQDATGRQATAAPHRSTAAQAAATASPASEDAPEVVRPFGASSSAGPGDVPGGGAAGSGVPTGGFPSGEAPAGGPMAGAMQAAAAPVRNPAGGAASSASGRPYANPRVMWRAAAAASTVLLPHEAAPVDRDVAFPTNGGDAYGWVSVTDDDAKDATLIGNIPHIDAPLAADPPLPRRLFPDAGDVDDTQQVAVTAAGQPFASAAHPPAAAQTATMALGVPPQEAETRAMGTPWPARPVGAASIDDGVGSVASTEETRPLAGPLAESPTTAMPMSGAGPLAGAGAAGDGDTRVMPVPADEPAGTPTAVLGTPLQAPESEPAARQPQPRRSVSSNRQSTAAPTAWATSRDDDTDPASADDPVFDPDAADDQGPEMAADPFGDPSDPAYAERRSQGLAARWKGAVWVPLALAAVPIALMCAVVPVVAALLVAVFAWVMHTVGVASLAQLRRETKRGGMRQGGDRMLTVVTLPWHLLRAFVAAVPGMLFALVVLVLMAAAAALVPGSSTVGLPIGPAGVVSLPLPSGSPRGAVGWMLGLGGALGWVGMAFAPSSDTLRVGLGRIWARRFPDGGAGGGLAGQIASQRTRTTRLVVVVMAMALTIAALTVVLTSGAIDWFPLATA